MTAPTQVYIGLGSNLGDPLAQITQALQQLELMPSTRLVRQSSLYSNRAIGPGTQPDYINAVAQLETTLEPLALLDQLQSIENRQGRIRQEHWGARTLDLDLLLYGNWQIHCERLTVPHPHMQQRDFVLYPLAEIAADLTLPTGEALAELLAKCPGNDLIPVTI